MGLAALRHLKTSSKYIANDQTKLSTLSTLTNVNLTVKAAWPHQGWIKDIGAVGAGQHNDVCGRAESWTREKQVSPSRARPAAVSSPLHTWPPLSRTTAHLGSCHRQETVALVPTVLTALAVTRLSSANWEPHGPVSGCELNLSHHTVSCRGHADPSTQVLDGLLGPGSQAGQEQGRCNGEKMGVPSRMRA